MLPSILETLGVITIRLGTIVSRCCIVVVEIVGKVVDLYMDFQYVRHHMAKKIINTNISPSIVIDMNADYVTPGGHSISIVVM